MSDSTTAPHPESDRWFVRCLHWIMQPKIGLPLAVLMLLVGAPLGYRGAKLSRVPDAPEPFDIAAFKADLVADEDNAATLFVEATKLLTKMAPDEEWKWEIALEGGWEKTTPDLRQWVADNRVALETWQQGVQRPDSQYIKPGELRIDTLLPMTQEARQINRLLVLEASRLQAEGQPVEAWNLLLNGLRGSHHLARRGSLIEYLVGSAIQSLVSNAMVRWAQVPDVSEDMLRQALTQLREQAAHRPSPKHAFQMESLWMRDLLRPDNLWDAMDSLGTGTPGGSTAQYLWGYLNGEPQISAKAASHAHGRILEQVEKRRCERTKTGGSQQIFEPDRSRPGPHWSADDISRFLDETLLAKCSLPSLTATIKTADRNTARHDLLEVVLALELHRRLKGSYPERADELVPDLLPSWPDDAMSFVKIPLRYQRDGESAKVWSVGDNAVDDGGLIDPASASSPAVDLGFQLEVKRGDE